MGNDNEPTDHSAECSSYLVIFVAEKKTVVVAIVKKQSSPSHSAHHKKLNQMFRFMNTL